MKKEYPTYFQRATCWGALTGLSLFVIVALLCGLIYGLGRAFVALEPVLLPVIIAGILAYLLFPCVLWVQKRVKRRVVAVLTVMAAAALLLLALAAAVVPPLVKQSRDLYDRREQIIDNAVAAGKDFLLQSKPAQHVVDALYSRTLQDAEENRDLLPDESLERIEHAKDYTSKFSSIINFYSSSFTEVGLRWLTAGSRALYGAAGFLIGMLLIPVFLFYFLLHSENIAQHWHTILPLRRSEFRRELVETLQQINGYIISFVRGQMLVSLIDGVLLGIALMIMGLPYAITIAAAASLLGIIPYIGMIFTSVPALLIAWFEWHDPGCVAIVALIFFSISQFDSWILQPKLLGKLVGMHDLTIMFSVLFWGIVLGGIVGALLAVPLTASIKVIFTRYVWSSLRAKDRPPAAAAPSENANASL